jgi:ADP-ribose pyrophosphatase YjhB (NUDIX family)
MNIITQRYTNYLIEYLDSDDFSDVPKEKVTQTYGVCFYNGQMVIGFGGNKQSWGLIGGTIEEGETYEQTLKREIQEESNMEVLSAIPIGYQKLTDTRDGKFVYQLRYACSVHPYGPFESDPAGSITEIKLIEPTEYKNYFDWGKTGDRIMERAFSMRFAVLLKELDNLGLPRDQFAITSSGPLGVRGIRPSKDIDIVASESLWNELSNKYQAEHLEFNDSIKIGNIEILGNFQGEQIHSTEDQIAKADIIDGYQYVNLEMIKDFKKLLGREKDLKDIELIEKFLSK